MVARKDAYDKLDEDDKAFFDSEKLTNPYVDTRINTGDPDLEVRGMLVGVDMQVGEMLLADRLREKGEPIDLVLAHHPEGSGFAELHEVMGMQADLWAAQGVSIAAADVAHRPPRSGGPTPASCRRITIRRSRQPSCSASQSCRAIPPRTTA